MAEKKATGTGGAKKDDQGDEEWWSPLGGMQDLAQASLSRLLELIQPPLRQLQELVSTQQANVSEVISRISKRLDQLQRELERQGRAMEALATRLTKQLDSLRTAQRGTGSPAKKTTSRTPSPKPKTRQSGTTKKGRTGPKAKRGQP
jgi:predicted RNase H-like nuclease (RuvC/YqgF family)